MSYRTLLVPGLAALAAGVLISLALSGRLTSEAVQNPTIAFDVVTSGNTYSDLDNSMAIGPTDSCLTTAPPGNNLSHVHTLHVTIRNVEDLIGWQARVNYIGNEWRPNTVSFAPFADTSVGQNVSFVNLPIDQTTFVHRDLVFASSIPASAPGPQTAAFGSAYLGEQNAAISPDTPAKAIPDDSSYTTTGGGVLASVDTAVLAGNAGKPSMVLNLDDGSPNAPGSGISYFDGTRSQTIDLSPGSLGDAFHGEGATCTPFDCVNFECPQPCFPTPCPTRTESPSPPPPTPSVTPTPTCTCEPTPSTTPTMTPTATPAATPTPTPAAGHDARLVRIGGVPKTVRLSPGEVFTDSGSIVVENQSAHVDNIGVYVDIAPPPSGGCAPSGRVVQMTVTLGPGGKTTIPVPVGYSCADAVAASGLSYTWVAVADHGADDLASCGPGSLQGVACFNALASDDADAGDNRASRAGPRVIAQ